MSDKPSWLRGELMILFTLGLLFLLVRACGG
jgi:hypothetical protein